MQRERASFVQIAANVGCVLGIVVALAVGVVAVLRSDAVTVSVRRVTPETAQVQSALRKQLRAPELTVRVPGEDSATLAIDVVNAPFLADLELGTPEALQAALHVAGHARDALPPGAHYEHYEVLLERHAGIALAPVPSHTYRFAAADLPPR